MRPDVPWAMRPTYSLGSPSRTDYHSRSPRAPYKYIFNCFECSRKLSHVLIQKIPLEVNGNVACRRRVYNSFRPLGGAARCFILATLGRPPKKENSLPYIVYAKYAPRCLRDAELAARDAIVPVRFHRPLTVTRAVSIF